MELRYVYRNKLVHVLKNGNYSTFCDIYFDEKPRVYKSPNEAWRYCPECINSMFKRVSKYKQEIKRRNINSNIYYKIEQTSRQMFESMRNKHPNIVKESASRDGYYDFIPHNQESVVRVFMKIASITNKPINSFLDVGCGPGNILWSAKTILNPKNTHGIEYDSYYASIAEVLLSGMLGSKVFNMDALNFDRYEDYDVIYFYCPISNRKLQVELERKKKKKMKVGAYYVPMLKQDNGFEKTKRFKNICSDDVFLTNRLFQKIK